MTSVKMLQQLCVNSFPKNSTDRYKLVKICQTEAAYLSSQINSSFIMIRKYNSKIWLRLNNWTWMRTCTSLPNEKNPGI